MLRTLVLAATAVFVLPIALVACGGGDDDAGTGGTATAPPAAAVRTSTVAGASTPGTGTAAVSTLQLSAKDLEYSTDTLTATANSKVELKFTNNDAVPHNFALYRTDKATDDLFTGDFVTGPDKSETYTFTAPTAGEYYFRCDVHPDQMHGVFKVTG